jgi:formylglycine-generating enzyme required for sulfatase activity
MSALKQAPNRWPRWAVPVALCLLLPLASHAADPKRNLTVARPADSASVKEQRVALVIGNSNYKSAPLKNPVNDAQDIARSLQGLGFQVTLKQNQGRDAMAQAIREFGNQLKRGGTGLFYYAGHGMQVKGKNFLLPVDADIQSEDEVPYRGIDANELLAKMESAKNRVNIVILDACRNNPFARSFRSSAQGLAQMDAPVGTLVAFATAPGSVAADGTGRNGLYTQHLLASLNQPGLKIEDVFKRVRVGVRQGSRGKQIPWENTSLEGDFYFKPGKPGEAPAQLASLAPTLTPEPAPGAEATGETWTDPVTGMEFVWIPKGCYQMGSPAHEKDHQSDERQHEVCVEGYWMGKYEVTNAQYRQFRPSHGADDNLPVTNVNWTDAMHFAQWLSEKSGKKIRLPTEAEWEYAARAGTQTARYWGDSWDARHNFAAIGAMKPVGSHQPNAFGLHDMLGNVWEWTASTYDSSYSGGERQVASLDAGGRRVIRGGTWTDGPGYVRSAIRYGWTPADRTGNGGFRLSRIP